MNVVLSDYSTIFNTFIITHVERYDDVLTSMYTGVFGGLIKNYANPK